MKKLIPVLSLLLITSMSASAQLGLKNLKKKAEEAGTKIKDATTPDKSTTTTTTTNTSSSSSSSSSASKGNKANVEASPAAASIRNYRNALSFAKDAVEGKHDDAEERLEKLGKLLAKIKQEDPNWAEYSQDEAAYADLQKKFEANNADALLQKRLERFQLAMHYGENESIGSALNYAEDLTVSNYEDLKKSYAAQGKALTSYETKVFNKAETFYKEIFPTMKTDFLKAIDRGVEGTDAFASANRAKKDYLDHVSVSFLDPRGHIAKLDEHMKDCDRGLVMFPADQDIITKKADLGARKADLEKYISSGDLDKDIAKRKQMDIDEVLFSKVRMTDAGLDAIVKRDFDVESSGAIQRICLTSDDWYIRKNEYGLILNKTISVQVASKLDGKCYLVDGYILCEYEGGGKYGKPHYYYDGKREMNCNNVSKNSK